MRQLISPSLFAGKGNENVLYGAGSVTFAKRIFVLMTENCHCRRGFGAG